MEGSLSFRSIEHTYKFSPLIFIFLKNMLFLFLQRKKRRGIRIFYDQEIQPFRIQDSDTKYHSVQYCYRPRSSSEVNKIIILNFLCLHLISEYLCTVTISNLNTFNFLSWKKPVKENVCYKLFWKIDGMLEENF